MENTARIEQNLEATIERATSTACPPGLSQAIHHAVFPGGARVRPSLTLAVADACGCDDAALADGAAVAVELLHCASLIHDDLPCFDNADMRRGKPSVHVLHGEPLAVLAGDALIVEAFNAVTQLAGANPERAVALVGCISKAVGMTGGITAGQAWESETVIDVAEYHSAKTGALFVGAVSAGAIAAGQDPAPWRAVGANIGAAYQIADDLLDAVGTAAECGKPVAQDVANARPSAVTQHGVAGAMVLLKDTVTAAANAVPDCDHVDALRALIISQAKRLVPAKHAHMVA
ncbi:MAG: polyprenyl synthetase family protein [Pseudomonadota bacterium]